jgi:fluoride exporter
MLKAFAPWFLVALGGALGSVLRFAFSGWLLAWASLFPFATLAANLLGCFLAGVFLQLSACWASSSLLASPWWRVLWVSGFLGGLTTFSSLQMETFLLWQTQHPYKAVFNLSLSVILGLLALLLGQVVIKALAWLFVKASCP